MKTLFLLLAITLLYPNQNLNIYTKKDVNITFKNGIKVFNKSNGQLLTGVVQDYNSKGILRTETTYKNGKKTIYKKYSVQGNLIKEIEYKNDKKNGFSKFYYENGILQYIANYVNDKENGISRRYNKQGVLTGETPYKMGKKEGLSKSYTDKGIISREWPYKEDKEHGIVKFYDNNGKLQLEIPYKHGKKHGIKKAYEEDGELNFEIPFVDGKPHGIEKRYMHKYGLTEEIPYVEGKKHGLSTTYNKNGEVSYEITYKNGKPHGFEREYYQNGSIRSEQLYKNGMAISGFNIDKKGKKTNFEIDKYYNKIILLKQNNQKYKRYDKDLKRGVPPIYAAIQNHLHKELLTLLASGADIELKNKFGTTPLSFAIHQRNKTTIKILLDYGANPNVIDDHGLYTPLSEAIISNKESLVNLILSYDVDVNFQSNKSETALTIAAKGCNKFKIVTWLLAKGANPDLIDRFGFTTKTGLFRYCKKDTNYKKMMKLLEDGIPDINGFGTPEYYVK